MARHGVFFPVLPSCTVPTDDPSSLSLDRSCGRCCCRDRFSIHSRAGQRHLRHHYARRDLAQSGLPHVRVRILAGHLALHVVASLRTRAAISLATSGHGSYRRVCAGVAATGCAVSTTAEPLMDPAIVIALLSLSISAVLALVRLYEFVRDRSPHLSAITRLTSDPDIGNEVTLLNASKVPANIYHYDLVRAHRSPLGKNWRIGRKVVGVEFDLEGDNVHVTVDAYSQTIIPFTGQDHFDWGGALKHDLYIRLWMVGRHRPLWLWVTGPF